MHVRWKCWLNKQTKKELGDWKMLCNDFQLAAGNFHSSDGQSGRFWVVWLCRIHRYNQTWIAIQTNQYAYISSQTSLDSVFCIIRSIDLTLTTICIFCLCTQAFHLACFFPLLFSSTQITMTQNDQTFTWISSNQC